MKKNSIIINDCNNIEYAKIDIIPGYLNIKYGCNGIGKSTIARVIHKNSLGEPLLPFTPFGSEKKPSISLQKKYRKVLIFNEEYVKSVLSEEEVMPGAYEIFIKSQEYERRLGQINHRLKGFRVGIKENEKLINFYQQLSGILSKFHLTINGSLTKKGVYKSILEKEHIYKPLPPALTKFKIFVDNEFAIDWLDWKHQGGNFDVIGNCPFCAESLNNNYQEEKTKFTKVFAKNVAKNLKETIDLLHTIGIFIKPEKLQIIENCIRTSKDIETIEFIFLQLIHDVDYIVNRIRKIIEFDSILIGREELDSLNQKILELRIDPSSLSIINSKAAINLFSPINRKIDILLGNLEELKREISKLNSNLKKSIFDAKKDIDTFLESSGIKYRINFEVKGVTDTRILLEYIDRTRTNHKVEKIQDHLSWGERNAFALLLFMHFSQSQKADLIILDDPVSSFDDDKKYAIIYRLFNNFAKKTSLFKKTVLLLTHDLEPVIDFVILNQPTGANVSTSYLANHDGKIFEEKITKLDLVTQIQLNWMIAQNKDVNLVNRMIALRKYIENQPDDKKRSCKYAYDIIASGLKDKETPDTKLSRTKFKPLSEYKKKSGIKYIKTFIDSFVYEDFIILISQSSNIVDLYRKEKNPYFKMQLFRLLANLDENRAKLHNKTILHFIKETYHIENDYLYNLNFQKFSIIPSFITKKCDDFVNLNYPQKGK